MILQDGQFCREHISFFWQNVCMYSVFWFPSDKVMEHMRMQIVGTWKFGCFLPCTCAYFWISVAAVKPQGFFHECSFNASVGK
jgi:hypothetical protein